MILKGLKMTMVEKFMKIIIIIEKYGGFCNRFFQSLHYHAFSIENNIYFLILLCWVY